MSRLLTNAIRSLAASSDAMTIDSAGKPAFPNGGVGKILQVVSVTKTDVFSQSLTYGGTSGDITGLTVSITPSSASNKILLDTRVMAGHASTGLDAYFYKDGSLITGAIGDAGADGRAAFGSRIGGSFRFEMVQGMYLDTAGGTSAITYSIRIGNALATDASQSRTLYINRSGDDDEAYSIFAFKRYISTFTAMEVAA